MVSENIIEINDSNFEQEVIEKSKEMPVIVDFWASWCGPCQMMRPIFEELSREFEGKLKFAKLNVEQENELSSMFGISGIPSLVIINRRKEIGRIIGFAPKEVLKTKIENFLANS